MSRGIDGMIVVDEAGAAWRAGPSPERGDYPVGSGDAALAGFLAAIADGATTAQAARHAVAAGTANALQPGQAEITQRRRTGPARGDPRVDRAGQRLVAGRRTRSRVRHRTRDRPTTHGPRACCRDADSTIPEAEPMTLEPVDPALVPQRVVRGGATMPGIGLGTFGSDHVPGERVAAAVYDAIRLGYRHIDCAAVYGNEHLIGESLERAIADGRAA